MDYREILIVIGLTIMCTFLCVGGLLWWNARLKVHESQHTQKVHMTHLYK